MNDKGLVPQFQYALQDRGYQNRGFEPLKYNTTLGLQIELIPDFYNPSYLEVKVSSSIDPQVFKLNSLEELEDLLNKVDFFYSLGFQEAYRRKTLSLGSVARFFRSFTWSLTWKGLGLLASLYGAMLLFNSDSTLGLLSGVCLLGVFIYLFFKSLYQIFSEI